MLNICIDQQYSYSISNAGTVTSVYKIVLFNPILYYLPVFNLVYNKSIIHMDL